MKLTMENQTPIDTALHEARAALRYVRQREAAGADLEDVACALLGSAAALLAARSPFDAVEKLEGFRDYLDCDRA